MKNGRKFKIATALRYKRGYTAPIIVAQGRGVVADNIINAAKKSKVPIHVDPDCASLLSLIEINNEIPEELYEVVAKVLSFVSSIDKEFN